VRPVAKTSKVQPRVQGTEARRQLAEFLSRFTTEVERVAQQALKKMRARMPGAVQLVYDNYNALAIGFGATERMSDVVCSIAVFPRWASLFFFDGTQLADPEGLLKGSGSRVRHIVLKSADDLDTPAVRALLSQALDLADPPIPRSGKAGVVIKSVSAKRRPRRPASAPASPRRR
jgi:hypothetical protein